MNHFDRPLSVLHVIDMVTETSAPYNEHVLANSDRWNLAVCTYFESDIVVPDSIKLFPGDSSPRGFFRGLRAALSVGEYDVIHTHPPHVGFPLLLIALITNRKAICRTIHTVHSSYSNYKFKHRLMLVPILALYRRIVFCSNASFESFPAFHRRLGGARARVVQNGVDIDRIDCALETGATRQRDAIFTVVVVGRLVRVKNPTIALSAFQQSGIQTGRLLFIGDGPLRQSLVNQAEGSDLSGQVDFTGMIPRERVYKSLARASVFASTSKAEGLPIAVLEAMACGCPVILSDIPPHREIAAGESIIPLIPPHDVTGFAREIKRFKEMSPHERCGIGNKCRRIVEERFSLPRMLASYEDVYAEMLESNE